MSQNKDSVFVLAQLRPGCLLTKCAASATDMWKEVPKSLVKGSTPSGAIGLVRTSSCGEKTLTSGLLLLTASFLVSIFCLFVERVWKTVLEARHLKRKEIIGKLEAKQLSRI